MDLPATALQAQSPPPCAPVGALIPQPCFCSPSHCQTRHHDRSTLAGSASDCLLMRPGKAHIAKPRSADPLQALAACALAMAGRQPRRTPHAPTHSTFQLFIIILFAGCPGPRSGQGWPHRTHCTCLVTGQLLVSMMFIFFRLLCRHTTSPTIALRTHTSSLRKFGVLGGGPDL